MFKVICAKGELIRTGRYINFSGETVEDALLNPRDGGGQPWTDLSSPPQRGFIDVRPFTVLPGLVDCHVHLALPPPKLGACDLQVMGERLDDFLNYGVIAVRDGGDRQGATLRLKTDREIPRLIACGPALHPPGSYGTFLGPPFGPGRMLEQIAELAEKGADQIKVLVTGPVNLESMDVVEPPHFSIETLSLVVGEAHRHNLKVMAHANGVSGVRLALNCGVDSLEHGYGMDADTLDVLAKSAVTWVPTLAPMAALAADGPVNLHDSAASVLAAQMKAVSRAHSLGIELAVGTDAGAPGVRHGSSYLWELRLLRQAGLSPADLIRAATCAGARLLNLFGTDSSPYRPLAYIAVDGNPLEELAALHRVRLIII